jgi:ADP-heptose:LPS heptosyltransferase
VKRSWVRGAIWERAWARWLKPCAHASEQLDIFRCLQQAHRILIVPNDRVGGLFMAGPVYKLLRETYADAELHLLVDTERASLAAQIPFADKVLSAELDRPVWSRQFRQSQKMLAAAEFDLAFCLGGDCSYRLAYLCTHSGARARVGFSRPGVEPHTIEIATSNAARHESEQYLRMLQMLGIQGDSVVRWSLDAAKAEQMRKRYLTDEAASRTVALDLSRGEGRGLTARQVDEIIGRIVERGARALLFFSAAERKQVSALVTSYSARVVPFELADLATAALLLPACQTLIACNTDLLHMAMALQIPVVGLFDEEPQRWVQYGNELIKVIHVDDLRTVSVARVGRSLDEALSENHGRREAPAAGR